MVHGTYLSRILRYKPNTLYGFKDTANNWWGDQSYRTDQADLSLDPMSREDVGDRGPGIYTGHPGAGPSAGFGPREGAWAGVGAPVGGSGIERGVGISGIGERADEDEDEDDDASSLGDDGASVASSAVGRSVETVVTRSASRSRSGPASLASSGARTPRTAANTSTSLHRYFPWLCKPNTYLQY